MSVDGSADLRLHHFIPLSAVGHYATTFHYFGIGWFSCYRSCLSVRSPGERKYVSGNAAAPGTRSACIEHQVAAAILRPDGIDVRTEIVGLSATALEGSGL